MDGIGCTDDTRKPLHEAHNRVTVGVAQFAPDGQQFRFFDRLARIRRNLDARDRRAALQVINGNAEIIR